MDMTNSLTAACLHTEYDQQMPSDQDCTNGTVCQANKDFGFGCHSHTVMPNQ